MQLWAALVENPAERRDLNSQVGVLNHRPPPDGRHDLFFGDEFARPLDKHAENIECSQADCYRNENAALIASRQTLASPVETKSSNRKMSAVASAPLPPVLPRVRAPFKRGASLPGGFRTQSCSDRGEFAAFLEFFFAAFVTPTPSRSAFSARRACRNRSMPRSGSGRRT
jgi:hypothetical protein